MAGDTTIGVYYAEEELDELEAFDDVAAEFQDRRRYSRSRAVRDAMEMYQIVLETMDELGWPVADMSKRDRRAAVRQALRDMEAREES